MTPTQAEQAAKWLMGGLAVVAAFLLAQPSLELNPIVQVALGAFLAFAAYANPAGFVNRDKPTLP
jgi:hypothetical protein